MSMHDDQASAGVPATGEIIVEARRVKKRFGSLEVLKGITMNVRRGEVAVLIGPSGSGKSTFLRLVLREERPTKGQVWVLGKELNRLSNWKIPAMRRQIGTVFQDFRLLPNKTVFENVAFALEVIGKPSSLWHEDSPTMHEAMERKWAIVTPEVGRVARLRVKLRRRDGRNVWTEFISTRIDDTEGKVTYLSVVSDVAAEAN